MKEISWFQSLTAEDIVTVVRNLKNRIGLQAKIGTFDICRLPVVIFLLGACASINGRPRHPKRFFSLTTMSDHRQAEVTRYLATLSREVGALFAVRDYKDIAEGIGPEAKAANMHICDSQRQQYH